MVAKWFYVLHALSWGPGYSWTGWLMVQFYLHLCCNICG